MRLFVAVDFPKEINDYLFFLQSFFRDVHLVRSFHLTLKFFGEAELEPIIEKLSQVNEKAFRLELSGYGVFPDAKRPKVIWVGTKEQPLLIALQKRMESLFPGMTPDFDFHPHITLARCNSRMDLPKIKIKPKPFEIKEFFLYQSTLTKLGPIYTKMGSFRLIR
jgi:RNA 2',3'-cyclic 3'-phosphodiesterase